MLKALEKAMCLSLIFSVMVSLVSFEAKCDVIKENFLRLHIIANSDSQADQQVKKNVRDRLIKEGNRIFTNADSFDEAVKMVNERMDEIKSAVADELKKSGCADSFTVQVKKCDFDTRKYDTVTLPAGEYTALEIVIGEGRGHNWWCVMFPSLCIPAVSQKNEVDKAVDGKFGKIVKNYNGYKPAFKIVEWYEKLKKLLK